MLIVVEEEEEEVKVRHNYIKYLLSVTNYCFFINPDGGKDTTGIVVGVIFALIGIAIIVFVILRLDLFGVVILSSNDNEMLVTKIIILSQW